MPKQFQNPSAPPGPPMRRLAISLLVLGFLALVLSPSLFGRLLGAAGIVVAILHIWKYFSERRLGRLAVWLSIFGVIASVGFYLFYSSSFKGLKSLWAPASAPPSALANWEGLAAPDLSVTTVDGKTFQLSLLRGKWVVLDFWATWCPPCVREIPHFIQLENETTRKNLVIIGISDEETNILNEFINKRGINYPIASGHDMVAPYSDVSAIPTTFLIDRHGIIQSVLTGYHDLEFLRQKLQGPQPNGLFR